MICLRELVGRAGRGIVDADSTSRRLDLMRRSAAVTALRVLSGVPSSAFLTEVSRAAAAARETGGRAATTPVLTAGQVRALKGVTAASLGALAAFPRSRAANVAAAVSFLALNGYVASIYPRVWNYNSHLNVQLGLTCWASCGGKHSTAPERDAAAVALLRLYPGLVYFQAGLSKLLRGGLAWATTGSTLTGYSRMIGTDLGRRLARSKPLMIGSSWVTILFELGYLPAMLIAGRRHGVLAAVATGFHLGTDAVLGISFWHLWGQYPAMHWIPVDSGQRAHVLGAVAYPLIASCGTGLGRLTANGASPIPHE